MSEGHRSVARASGELSKSDYVAHLQYFQNQAKQRAAPGKK